MVALPLGVKTTERDSGPKWPVQAGGKCRLLRGQPWTWPGALAAFGHVALTAESGLVSRRTVLQGWQPLPRLQPRGLLQVLEGLCPSGGPHPSEL